MAGRTIAIGDIHGCATALRVLVEAIAPGPDDRIVTLGDYIDRGPDSRGVVEQLLALADRCRLVPLLGNHEEMLFAAMEGRSDFDYWRKFGGDLALRSWGVESPKAIPSRHRDFLKGCRSFYETETHIFVHANYWPNRPMAEQPWNALLWEPLRVEWAGPHCSGKTVVVGHTPQKDGQPLDLGFLVCLDTNCCAGGWLTGLDVETGNYWQANQEEKLQLGKLKTRKDT